MGSLKILVVDDEQDMRIFVSTVAETLGFEAIAAKDGVEALEKARGNPPALVILDVMMPGKNGWEVAKEIRRDARFENVGIIMLTAIGEKINEMTSPLYGADEYVDKPFEFSDLEAKIAAVLAKRKKA